MNAPSGTIPSPATPAVDPVRLAHFRRPQRLGRIAIGTIALAAAAHLASLRLAWSESRWVERAIAGSPIRLVELEQFEQRLAVSQLALMLTFLAAGTAFLFWMHRARVNVSALNAIRTKYRVGWVLGGFLVPVLGLFRPYQVAEEIWRGSVWPPSPRARTGAWLVLVWWLLFLGGNVLSLFADNSFAVGDVLRTAGPAGEAVGRHVLENANLGMVSHGLSALAAIPAAGLIAIVNARQARAHAGQRESLAGAELTR